MAATATKKKNDWITAAFQSFETDKDGKMNINRDMAEELVRSNYEYLLRGLDGALQELRDLHRNMVKTHEMQTPKPVDYQLADADAQGVRTGLTNALAYLRGEIPNYRVTADVASHLTDFIPNLRDARAERGGVPARQNPFGDLRIDNDEDAGDDDGGDDEE